ncbi:MAG: NTPase [Candidatus Methanomethylicia archaeon]
MIIAITGRPGIGKSTVCYKVINLLKEHGFIVGGIICPEIRKNGVRIGFKVLDLISGREGLLAHINYPSQIRVGKYYVQLKSFEDVAIPALSSAVKVADVIVFDEIGPMELKSDKVLRFLSSSIDKPIILVVHWRIGEEKLRKIVRGSFSFFEVTFKNRDDLPKMIFNAILEHCGGK